MEANRLKSKKYYEANKEKHNAASMKYYEEHKDKLYEKQKQKKDRKRIDDVKAKLEQIDTEVLAKILIEARKTSLLNIFE